MFARQVKSSSVQILDEKPPPKKEEEKSILIFVKLKSCALIQDRPGRGKSCFWSYLLIVVPINLINRQGSLLLSIIISQSDT